MRDSYTIPVQNSVRVTPHSKNHISSIVEKKRSIPNAHPQLCITRARTIHSKQPRSSTAIRRSAARVHPTIRRASGSVICIVPNDSSERKDLLQYDLIERPAISTIQGSSQQNRVQSERFTELQAIPSKANLLVRIGIQPSRLTVGSRIQATRLRLVPGVSFLNEGALAVLDRQSIGRCIG